MELRLARIVIRSNVEPKEMRLIWMFTGGLRFSLFTLNELAGSQRHRECHWAPGHSFDSYMMFNVMFSYSN